MDAHFSLKAVAGLLLSALPLELHALYLDRSAMLDCCLAAVIGHALPIEMSKEVTSGK